MNFKGLSFLFLVFTSALSWSQNEVANNLIVDGNEAHEQAEYIDAEAQYRKAVSLAPEKSEALHNLGNTNYRIEDYSAASQRFFQTQKNTTSKNEKHAAFHNLGNVYMQQKDYAQAVAAFKNGLRNNPTDEETRYNYALAKELLEKEQQQDQQDEQNQRREGIRPSHPQLRRRQKVLHSVFEMSTLLLDGKGNPLCLLTQKIASMPSTGSTCPAKAA